MFKRWMSSTFRNDETAWDEAPQVFTPEIGVEESPKTWWLTFLYAWQHTLVDVSPFVLPLIIVQAVGYDAGQNVIIVQSSLVLMAIATLVQTTLGNRLPSVIGPSSSIIVAMATAGGLFGASAMWTAAFVGGIFMLLVGATGILIPFRKLLPPYVAGIVVLLIGVNLGLVAADWIFDFASVTEIALSGVAIALILVFVVMGHRLAIPTLARGSIIFTLLIVGVALSSVFGVIDYTEMSDAQWFKIPTVLPFGSIFTGGGGIVGGAIVGLIFGYVGAIAESLGDYGALAAVAGTKYRVRHMTRGITTEGVFSTIAPLFGAIPITTYSQNTGVVATTKVASRRVIQGAAVILLIYGLVPKVGSIIVITPQPIVGGIYLAVSGSIIVTGLRLIQTGPVTDDGWYTTAFTLIIAITVPVAIPEDAPWFQDLPGWVATIATNQMVIGVIIGVSLNYILQRFVAAEAASDTGQNEESDSNR